MTVRIEPDSARNSSLALDPEAVELLRSAVGVQPAVVRAAFSEPLTTAEEAFHACVAASDVERDLRGPLLQCFENGGRKHADYLHLLPTARDRTWSRYIARLEQSASHDFTLFMQHVQYHCPAVYQRALQFLSLVIPDVGATKRTYTDLFFGRYAATPIGIHRDGSHVFSYVVFGTKEYLLWPADTYAPIDDAEINSLRSTSAADEPKGLVRIIAEPGDLVYWPNGFWHVAVNGDWVLTCNIDIDAGFVSCLEDLAAGVVRRTVRGATDALNGAFRAGTAATTIRDALASASRALLDPATIEQAGIREAERVSARGFLVVPEPECDGPEIAPGKRYALKQSARLVAVGLDEKRLVLACNGRSAILERSPALDSCIGALESGPVLFSDDGDSHASLIIRTVLAHVASCGGLETV